MIGQGWRQIWPGEGFGAPHPSQFDVVEITREEWPGSEVVRWADLPPQMNINGLWWRPWQGPAMDGEIIDAEATEVPTDQKRLT